jgi:chromosome partitioning protein
MSIRLCIVSNAGGSGKTTLCVHLAYEMSQRNCSVALIDLDPQGSLSLFCGLSQSTPSQSTAAVLQDEFQGSWPLTPCWTDWTDKVSVCQGGLELTQSTQEISLHPRGSYLLADRLEDCPIPQDLVIFDCPATLGPLPLIALAAATHILVPVQPQPKSIQGSAKLLEWLYLSQKQLRLKPAPSILGFVPNQYDPRRAAQRQIVESLPNKLASMGIHCFSPIRDSAEFVNASAAGLPVQIYRPGHPSRADFKEITEKLNQLVIASRAR